MGEPTQIGNQLTTMDQILFFLVVPLLLLAVFLLPTEVRQQYFTLYSNNPTFPGAFLFNLNHLDYAHLANNLISYFVLMILISVVETNRRRFYLMMGILFIVLPFVLALANILLTPNIPPQVGFSGTVSGIIGYFTYATYCYLRKRFNVKLTPNTLFIIFMLNAEIAGVGSGIQFFQELMIVLIVLLTYLERKELRKLVVGAIEELRKYYSYPIRNRIWYGLIIVFAAFFIFCAVAVLVPKEIRNGSSLIAVHSHYLGYVIGLLTFAFSELVMGIKNELRNDD